jgi:hypothetical protein
LTERIFKLDAKKQITVIVVLWLLWGERDRRREQGRSRAPAETSYITAFQAVNMPKEKLLSESRQRSQWAAKPRQGELKIKL